MAELRPHYIDVDLKKNTQYNVPVVTQNDTATHFIIRVTDDGLSDPELLDAYQEITMTSQRPDGESFYLTGTRIPGTNEIEFHLGTDETAFSGSVLASLQFYLVEDASRYTSAQFRYDVKKDLTTNYTPTQREETLVEVVLRDGPGVIQEAREAIQAADGAIGRLEEVTEENKTIFREPVATFAALSTTYPNPEHGTTVRVTSESATYRYSDGSWVKTDEYNPTAIDQVTAQLAETEKETKKHFTTPQYVEYFASFNKYGMGTPIGINNYNGGNYVLIVSGNAGDSFVTVESGNIEDAGLDKQWSCVIENNDGLFDMNRVIGTDGISVINLLTPLKNSISSMRLGNLHDAVAGQHYTELGYLAYAQHLYFKNPRHTERNNYIAQFKPNDSTGSWVANAYFSYGNLANMSHVDGYFNKIGDKYASLNATSDTHYVEWEQILNGEKGYFESHIGTSAGSLIVEFYKDGELSETKTITKVVHLIVFDYEGVTNAKVRIKATQAQTVYLGLTTWWKNEKFQDEMLLGKNEKIVYMGDSWGERENYAVTREIERLMLLDGGSPTILNYSLGGHTSTYARVWFDEYVIENKPDKVVIEYFTNDFNSITNASPYVFINPDGDEQDMKIADINEYLDNIAYMVNKAIENGIQPIVLMPSGTDVENQSQKFANYAVQIWLGKSTILETPIFKTVTSTGKVVTNNIEANGTKDIVIKGGAVNSSSRKGVVVDSDVNLTNGSIQRWANNGVDVAGIRHDGTAEIKATKLIPQQFGVGTSSATRGTFYIRNAPSTNGIDELRIIIQLEDGTFVEKKVQLLDI